MHATARKQRAPQGGGWMSIHAAALALGTTRHTVQKRALNGELRTKLDHNGKRIVSRASVDALLAEQTESGSAA